MFRKFLEWARLISMTNAICFISSLWVIPDFRNCSNSTNNLSLFMFDLWRMFDSKVQINITIYVLHSSGIKLLTILIATRVIWIELEIIIILYILVIKVIRVLFILNLTRSSFSIHFSFLYRRHWRKTAIWSSI